MSKILNFGSLNIDYVYTVPHFVMPGETLAALERNVFAGGKGLNQSVAAARAGGDVYHAGAIGKDDSKVLTDTIAANKINDECLMRRDGPSGHTFIQVDTTGQNCILLYGGANQSITCEEIDSTLKNFTKGDYLILQNEINNIEYLIKSAAAKGMKVCFNVSPFTTQLLTLPLDKCAYLIVNEIEGSSMVNMPEDTDPYILIEKLAAKFPKTSFVLTLGVRGSVLKLKERNDVISCKSFKVKAVDTTGAGDTFLGYLIANLAANADPKLALKTAAAASAIAVTRKGAAPSIPLKEEVMEFLAKNKDEVLTDKI
ncbi:ribokinase [uncultured Succinatimonas sp.]|uniref:ribokinase n=1 Tax=uncultured Succinatimonas sp. TaxID=1262973 RepID=UPI0025D4B649|nr:ribokinase [uncultured Succinatimonas sp.]